MQIYLESVGLMVAILFCGFATILLTNEDALPVQTLFMAIVVIAAVALGMRIEAGVF